jgi:hypothetical protein
MASYCTLAVQASYPRAETALDDETISVGPIPGMNLNGVSAA